MKGLPSIHTLSREAIISADPEAVWPVIRAFDRIHIWHPEVPTPELIGDPSAPGARRVFGAGTDSEMVEELISIDDIERILTYRMIDPPFPITDHRAGMHAFPTENGTHVTWTASFDVSETDAAQVEESMGDGVFQPGLKGLAALFND